MKNIIENNDDQFANSQITRDLGVNSEATEPQTQLEVVNVIEQCPDMALEEFSAPENRERKPRRPRPQFLSEQIDADERLPGYLREPHLPRFESRSARNFAKQRVHRGDPLLIRNGRDMLGELSLDTNGFVLTNHQLSGKIVFALAGGVRGKHSLHVTGGRCISREGSERNTG